VHPRRPPASSWKYAPLNPTNNINNRTNIELSQYETLNNGSILGFQEKYVRRIVRELIPYDNVILNCSEDPWVNNAEDPPAETRPSREVKEFIRRVSEWIKDE